jgi:hypothetical protein
MEFSPPTRFHWKSFLPLDGVFSANPFPLEISDFAWRMDLHLVYIPPFDLHPSDPASAGGENSIQRHDSVNQLTN